MTTTPEGFNSSPNQPPAAHYLMKGTPIMQAGNKIGKDLADEAWLHDAGTQGMTAEKLQENWQQAYMLGRNAVESALGSKTPYAQPEVDKIRPPEK